MTSSCSLPRFCIGTHAVGPLPDSWASERPVGLGKRIFWTTDHMALGPTCGSVDRFAHEIPYMADLCRKNQHFWSRNLNYPRFFALFLDLLGHVLEILS